jgi:hypothetical protein
VITVVNVEYPEDQIFYMLDQKIRGHELIYARIVCNQGICHGFLKINLKKGVGNAETEKERDS